MHCNEEMLAFLAILGLRLTQLEDLGQTIRQLGNRGNEDEEMLGIFGNTRSEADIAGAVGPNNWTIGQLGNWAIKEMRMRKCLAILLGLRLTQLEDLGQTIGQLGNRRNEDEEMLGIFGNTRSEADIAGEVGPNN